VTLCLVPSPSARLRKAPPLCPPLRKKVWWDDTALLNDSHDGMMEKQRYRTSLL
jgi:hypothetical protein